MLTSYHAVSIRHSGRCCQAVTRLEDQRFLSTEAPRLPVEGCTSPRQCNCRYQHHTDRRDDARRDTDVGLPERMFFGPNRRSRPDRRADGTA
jgi:hypothetical protein